MPEIPYSTHYESAVHPGDPRCEVGRADNKGQICCPRTCGLCGGPNCASRPGGSAACCEADIVTAGKSCDQHEAPCQIAARLCLTGSCGPPPPPPHSGWAGGDKINNSWAVPPLAPFTPPQGALATPSLTPDNSCKQWTQYSSELQWSYVGYTQEQARPHSQFASNHIPISSRGACGTVYPREGDAQDGMFPPGRHGNTEPDKLQQLYYNTELQPATFCYHGGGSNTGPAGATQASTSWKQVCLYNNRETIGWPTKTGTYNRYGLTPGLTTTADFSIPLPSTGYLNKEYNWAGGIRIARDQSAHSDFPHSAVDQSVHGANSGFIVHSGMKDQCHDTTLRNSCKTVCLHDFTDTHTLPNQKQCTPCSLAQQCAPASPLHQHTTQTPASISHGTESTGGVWGSYPQPGLGTVDTGGKHAPGYITAGDHRRSSTS